MNRSVMRHGDFTGLAENYSRYRSGYAQGVRAALTGLPERPPGMLDVADVGAGTGIWTRMLAEAGFRSVVAVEPNEDMRRAGMRDCLGSGISWRAGSGEDTGLETASVDLVSMASSFHWVNFDKGTSEFCRILRPNGWFVALWNTRAVDENPLLAEIEAELTRLKPGLSRVAFSRQGLVSTLSERLRSHPGFTEVVELDGRHTTAQTSEHYLGTWRSVNDVRAQLGEEKFAHFLEFAKCRLAGTDTVDVTYRTRAWAARRA